ncbi:MAG: S-methyl-5-thioribose-1-phosphate isomerase [Pirellulales bacterium]
MSTIPTLEWVGDIDGHLCLLDQTRLPIEAIQLECRTVPVVEHAIKTLQVRGAPAIGIAAAYGVCIGIQDSLAEESALYQSLAHTISVLAASRPTAVNLFTALDRMRERADQLRGSGSPHSIAKELLNEARRIHDEDRAMCHAIGRFGSTLIPDNVGVLTHCNAGGLATSEYGTALAVIFASHESGKRVHAYVDETRPLLQGARLTAWELMQHGIPTTLICDNMAAQVMAEGKVAAVVVGADRIAANGDTANKIGTYGVALLARAHGIPFFVAAPTTTFDLQLSDGRGIPIEQRAATEVTHHGGRRLAPEGVEVYNPAFDVTPAHLIDALITDRGVIKPVNQTTIARILAAPPGSP